MDLMRGEWPAGSIISEGDLDEAKPKESSRPPSHVNTSANAPEKIYSTVVPQSTLRAVGDKALLDSLRLSLPPPTFTEIEARYHF
jgi:hypothetical protein